MFVYFRLCFLVFMLTCFYLCMIDRSFMNSFHITKTKRNKKEAEFQRDGIKFLLIDSARVRTRHYSKKE